ncbi:MAG TPA: PAS domain-containing sensor histidine kinase, partial [Cytophagaceae bacterium]
TIIGLLVLISTFVLMNYLRSKQQIIKEAERTRFLAESMPQKVWTADANGVKNYFNKRWIEYAGVGVQDLINGGWEKWVHPADYNEVVKQWNECLRLGKDFMLENRLLRFDNEYRWHLSRAVPQKDRNNRIIMWVGTDTDVHDQKSQTEELKRINADLDNFVYTASHDLKAPVSNIEGLITGLEDYLNEKSLITEDIRMMIKLINQSVMKFRDTIKDLTEITKIQKNLEDDVSDVSCEEILNDVKLSISDMISSTNAIIHTHLGDCRHIKFSRKNLKSIIYNLLSNAIKYRSPDRTPEIYIRFDKVDGYYLLIVKDNGLGLTSEQKLKVFNMFKRLHTHVEGTGIGLYIVKRIIENVGGKIEVESEKGVGSTFKVYIPET